ncbi:hypothetical protein E2C01_023844 [Portunus trituberculatus]|uniref:Uncharacterized protein n=1 Tax=Portunus trituberculatus TaxID=210409 RepID=A0A5B7EB31_PORTR|nr:hypothetical protein [Portunus trituberculatus]
MKRWAAARTRRAANRRPQQVEGRSVQCGPAHAGQRGLGMNLSEYSSGWVLSVPRRDSFVHGEGLYGHCQVTDTATAAARFGRRCSSEMAIVSPVCNDS